jgi:hypothetical protein
MFILSLPDFCLEEFGAENLSSVVLAGYMMCRGSRGTGVGHRSNVTLGSLPDSVTICVLMEE